MAKQADKSDEMGTREKDTSQMSSQKSAVNQFVDSLSKEHRMLVVLKTQLYGGHWEPMLDDLQNRLRGKPYIFKLADRIKEDIKRIEEIRNFENENDVDLSEYIHLD